MEFVLGLLPIGCCVVVIGCIFMLFKNENAFKNHTIIGDAIYQYHVDCVKHNRDILVSYDDMEKYTITEYRLTDWGYENILPKDKFEIIKPYIRVQEGQL